VAKQTKTQYECSACGHRSLKWLGRCPDCSEWNVFVEVRAKAAEAPPERSIRARPRGPSGSSRGGSPKVVPLSTAAHAVGGRPVAITSLPAADEAGGRVETTIPELDRILGGGLVPGSVTLVGGEPGVGKSTLLLQAAMAVAATGRRVLYASGEESVRQVQGRAERLGGMTGSLFLQAETSLDSILDGADGLDPAVIVLDSVQTVYVPELGGAPGNFSQVRECASRMVLHAKATGRAVVLVGHVTKDGKLAGPKTLEHIVDTVVYFEGDAHPPFRVLRSRKNRFGATGELGLFEMTGAGLIGVAEPSAMLLEDRPIERPGTVVTAAVEGSRTLLLEVQALVAPGFPGSVRRTALGIDGGRLAMLVAVLGKADLALHDKEVYINVVGGVRVTETAVDLAVAAAIVSSLLERPMPGSTFVVGEIGLTGEVRTVARLEQRLVEAQRHGFTRAVVPKLPRRFEAPEGLEIVQVATIEEVVQGLF